MVLASLNTKMRYLKNLNKKTESSQHNQVEQFNVQVEVETIFVALVNSEMQNVVSLIN